jgi:hypothetical protein
LKTRTSCAALYPQARVLLWPSISLFWSFLSGS